MARSCPTNTVKYEYYGLERCCPKGGVVKLNDDTSACTVKTGDSNNKHCAFSEESNNKHGCKNINICPDPTEEVYTQRSSAYNEMSAIDIYNTCKNSSVSLIVKSQNAIYTGSGFIIKNNTTLKITLRIDAVQS